MINRISIVFPISILLFCPAECTLLAVCQERIHCYLQLLNIETSSAYALQNFLYSVIADSVFLIPHQQLLHTLQA